MTNGDYFEEPKKTSQRLTVQDIRDRFAAAGLPGRVERDDTKARIVFERRKCFLVFTVDEFDRPSMASMPDTTDYDAEFAQIVFGVFDSIGWKFQP